MITGGVFFVKNYHDNNIDKTYINYVKNTLIPKYGKSSLYLENGSNLNIDSKKLLEKDAEGILFYRIINLDEEKKLLVGKIKIDYDAYSKGSIETSLIYDLYSINNKIIKKLVKQTPHAKYNIGYLRGYCCNAKDMFEKGIEFNKSGLTLYKKTKKVNYE